jgi:tetratricopeptide (TPR) repeat protein
MKLHKREKEDNFKYILKEFFDKYTPPVLNSKLPGKSSSTGNTKTPKKPAGYISSESLKLIQTDLQIDFIITKAETELTEDKLLALLSRLGNYFINSGEFTPAVYIFEKLVAISNSKDKLTKTTGDALLSLADIFSRQALWGISLNYINEAYKVYKKLNNNKGCADCENLLGTIHGELGNLNQAYTHFEKSLFFLKNRKNNAIKGKIEINLGIINNIQGNFDLALKYFHKALEKFTVLKDIKRIAEIRHNLGMLHSKKHQYKNAIREFDQSISLSGKRKFQSTLSLSYLGKAVIYAIQENYHLSNIFADKALEICHKINDRLSIADIYKVQGIIHRDTKNYELAENYLLTSLRINKELNNSINQAETEFELGLLYKLTGKKRDSIMFFLNARKYFLKIGALKELKEIDKLLS